MSNQDRNIDSLAKGLAEGRVTRGRALKMLGAAIFGGALTAALPGLAFAAPRTCVTCICGTGRPCNPKSSECTVVRGFSAEQSCREACEKQGQRLCGLGTSFHCPKGCPE